MSYFRLIKYKSSFGALLLALFFNAQIPINTASAESSTEYYGSDYYLSGEHINADDVHSDESTLVDPTISSSSSCSGPPNPHQSKDAWEYCAMFGADCPAGQVCGVKIQISPNGSKVSCACITPDPTEVAISTETGGAFEDESTFTTEDFDSAVFITDDYNTYTEDSNSADEQSTWTDSPENNSYACTGPPNPSSGKDAWEWCSMFDADCPKGQVCGVRISLSDGGSTVTCACITPDPSKMQQQLREFETY